MSDKKGGSQRDRRVEMVKVGGSDPPEPPPGVRVHDSSKSALPGQDPSQVTSTAAGQNTAGDTIQDEIRSEMLVRRITAAVVAVVGAGTIIKVMLIAVSGINEVLKAEAPGGHEYIRVVAMGAHAVISVAAVWFGYQMLRAAERLMVPRRFLANSTDVELLRALLGISAPTTALADQVKLMATTATDLIKASSEAVKAVQSTRADGDDKQA